MGTWIKGSGEPFLDQAIVKRLLRYSKKTGERIWRYRPEARANWNTRYAGRRAGSVWKAQPSDMTYRVIRIFDYPFFEHRLAILYVTGEWPINTVDHRDLDGENNKWRNLRQATTIQNCANRGCNKNSQSGFKGVSLTPNGRYRATIQFNRKWRQVGTFDTAEQAAAAYRAEAIRLAGEFARS